MINMKIIAVKAENMDVKELFKKVFTRQDRLQPTGIRVDATESEWQSDSSGYGGDMVDVVNTYNQKKVILNGQHNLERMEALRVLERRGGREVLKELISSRVQPVLGNIGQHNGQTILIVIDDRTFEDQIDLEIERVIEGLITRSTPEELMYVFKEEYSGQWNESRSLYLCGSCYEKSPDGFKKAIAKLVQYKSDYLSELYYYLSQTRNKHYVYGGASKSEFKDYEKIILDVMDDLFLSKIGLKQLAMLFLAQDNDGEFNARVRREIEGRSISFRDISGILKDIKGNTYSLSLYLYSLAAKNALENIQDYSLLDLIELYSHLSDSSLFFESKPAIFKEIERRMTIKDAIDLVNDGLSKYSNILDIQKILFRCIAENSTNEEVKRLNVHKFNNLLSDIQSNRNRRHKEHLTTRYRYPIDDLIGNLANAEEIISELRALGAEKISDSFLERLVNELKDEDVTGHNIGVALLFTAVSRPVSIQGLFKLADLVIDNMEDRYNRLIPAQLNRLSLVLMMIRKQRLTNNDLTELEGIFISTEAALAGIGRYYKKEINFVLAQIAQMIEKLDPESVKQKRGIMEWLRGERPWAKRKIRKTLIELERLDRLNAGHKNMDERFPVLANYRNIVSPVPQDKIEAIYNDLPRIMDAIDDPYFDYYELLRKPELLTYIASQKTDLALLFFEKLIENLYKKFYEYGGWNYSYQCIIDITNAIVAFGGPNATEVLKRMRKQSWRALKLDVRGGYIRRSMKEAIAKLES